MRALSAEEHRHYRLSLMAAIDAMPYFASALLAMTPVAAAGLGTLGVDPHWRVYIDPDHLTGGQRGWSVPEVGAVMLHEIGHLLRDHAGRAAAVPAPLDQYHWNVAGDAEINDDLIAAGVTLPGEPITPAGIGCEPGRIAEHYYAELVPPGENGGGPGDGSSGDCGADAGPGCGSGSGDRRLDCELPAGADVGSGPGLDSAEVRLVKIATARAVADEASRTGNAGRGTVPAGVQRWAHEQLTPATVPWTKTLASALRRAVGDRSGQLIHSWRHPNRRGGADVLLPALRAPKITVDLIVDTSGSMGTDDLTAALSETRGVLKAVGVTVRLWCCDAQATEPRRIAKIADVRLVGGGGTDLRVGIDAALAARPNGDVLVVFTDGGTPWHDKRLPVPLIVGLIGAHAIDSAPQWARTIRIAEPPTGAA